jgi:hypothetical protein
MLLLQRVMFLYSNALIRPGHYQPLEKLNSEGRELLEYRAMHYLSLMRLSLMKKKRVSVVVGLVHLKESRLTMWKIAAPMLF